MSVQETQVGDGGIEQRTGGPGAGCGRLVGGQSALLGQQMPAHRRDEHTNHRGHLPRRERYSSRLLAGNELLGHQRALAPGAHRPAVPDHQHHVGPGVAVAQRQRLIQVLHEQRDRGQRPGGLWRSAGRHQQLVDVIRERVTESLARREVVVDGTVSHPCPVSHRLHRKADPV